MCNALIDHQYCNPSGGKVAIGYPVAPCSGVNTVVSEVHMANSSGVALLWKESDLHDLEEAEVRGPNVIHFELMMETDHYYVVGCYIPSSITALATLQNIDQEIMHILKEYTSMVADHLNNMLKFTQNSRDETVVKVIDIQSHVFHASFCALSATTNQRTLNLAAKMWEPMDAFKAGLLSGKRRIPAKYQGK